MDKKKPLARTFYDDQLIEVEILSMPTSTGLVRVLWIEKDKTLVRHKDRLTSINEEAKAILK